jgi:DNA-damage-inducible protein J
MSKTQTTIRLDESDYKEAREILKYVGMSYSQAVNMFNRMVVLNQGLPFEAKIPNEETLRTIQDAREGKNLTRVSLDELKREAGA